MSYPISEDGGSCRPVLHGVHRFVPGPMAQRRPRSAAGGRWPGTATSPSCDASRGSLAADHEPDDAPPPTQPPRSAGQLPNRDRAADRRNHRGCVVGIAAQRNHARAVRRGARRCRNAGHRDADRSGTRAGAPLQACAKQRVRKPPSTDAFVSGVGECHSRHSVRQRWAVRPTQRAGDRFLRACRRVRGARKHGRRENVTLGPTDRRLWSRPTARMAGTARRRNHPPVRRHEGGLGTDSIGLGIVPRQGSTVRRALQRPANPAERSRRALPRRRTARQPAEGNPLKSARP